MHQLYVSEQLCLNCSLITFCPYFIAGSSIWRNWTWNWREHSDESSCRVNRCTKSFIIYLIWQKKLANFAIRQFTFSFSFFWYFNLYDIISYLRTKPSTDKVRCWGEGRFGNSSWGIFSANSNFNLSIK